MMHNLPADTWRDQNTILGYSIQIFLHGCSCQATSGYLPPAKGVMYSVHGVQLVIVSVRLKWDYHLCSSESYNSKFYGSFEMFLISCQHTIKIINVALFYTSSLARLLLFLSPRYVKYS